MDINVHIQMYPCCCGEMRRLAERIACVLRTTLLMTTGAPSPVQKIVHQRGIVRNIEVRSCSQLCYGKAMSITYSGGGRGGTVVKALCYKSEGRWFDSRWCHWNFSLT
jgi:hypothetical protein